ncbi:MAG: hypothetical protein A3E87_01345 [Gammaproteobacteria bacterium RIFCSPHIGHO2_12_FULL_35_23]|nr:MAG: hypothetical protein A3E87_01345 [Gammaproteobacteria bacterium RIFCSPHIGHO2_12_FULL_35_23]
MKKINYALIISTVLLLASGCTLRYTPDIYNVNKAPVVTKTHQATLTQVGKAITSAGVGLGWSMQEVRPGYIVATLNLRAHQAKVGITYTTQTYNINYISSNNLMRNGEIHQNYNSWVQNLNTAIKHQLEII